MSYVRNRNTLSDLLDVFENLSRPENEDEKTALVALIKTCGKIIENSYGEADVSRSIEWAKNLRTVEDIEYGED